MQRATSIAAALAMTAALGGCSMMNTDGGWTTLIDAGLGLENFNRVGDANWRVEDGAIVADHKDSKPSAFLMTKQSYSDFEIKAEFWVSHDANSGIYMRCADGAAPTDTTCYEANIFDERPDPLLWHRRHHELREGAGAEPRRRAVEPLRHHREGEPHRGAPQRQADRGL